MPLGASFLTDRDRSALRAELNSLIKAFHIGDRHRMQTHIGESRMQRRQARRQRNTNPGSRRSERAWGLTPKNARECFPCASWTDTGKLLGLRNGRQYKHTVGKDAVLQLRNFLRKRFFLIRFLAKPLQHADPAVAPARSKNTDRAKLSLRTGNAPGLRAQRLLDF